MFIETQATPNPNTIKFLPGREVSAGRLLEFTDAAEAEARSPLAARLLAVPGVKAVFLGRDFVSVTKNEDADWAAIKAELLSRLVDHFLSGEPVVLDAGAHEEADDDTASDGAEDSDTVRQIKAVLEEKVAPAVARDGGHILFHSFEDGVVYLEMQGACAGCPSSVYTLKQGIENLLRYYVPAVREVRPVM
ncbi:MAG: NifU family protein [Alphaproteobacteria bacterium]|nr:MAG: NifU family protein [Alphaproteobacteria bacterium]